MVATASEEGDSSGSRAPAEAGQASDREAELPGGWPGKKHSSVEVMQAAAEETTMSLGLLLG